MKKKTKVSVKKKKTKVSVTISVDKVHEAEQLFSLGSSIAAVAKRAGITEKQARVLYERLQR
jgi:hypothetical protein